jgi:hypothetical protein
MGEPPVVLFSTLDRVPDLARRFSAVGAPVNLQMLGDK